MKTSFVTVGEVDRQRSASGKLYREFLRVPAMSSGLYVLAAGAVDPQRPHHEDEMYYVIRGRARFRAGNNVGDPNDNAGDSTNSDDREVSAGSVIFVAAEVEHRFYDVEEDLTVLVFFAPAES